MVLRLASTARPARRGALEPGEGRVALQRTAMLVTVLASLSLAVPARAGETAASTPSTPAASTGESTPSAPPPASTGGWLLGGSTVGVGQTEFLGEFGWPGIDLSILHGLSERFDVGGTFAFVYGLEGMTSVEGVSAIAPGFKLNAILKLNLLRQSKFNLGLRLNPGFAFYVPSWQLYVAYASNYRRDPFMFGFQFPLEVLAGIPVLDSLSVNVGISVPMVMFFAPAFSFVVQVQPGFGLEYKVDSSIALTLDTRFGPSFTMPAGARNHTEFSFRALFGVAYRF